MPKSLKRNISWSFIGNVIFSASQWGMLIVLAKLSTVEDVGKFALGLSIVGPVYAFANMELRSVQATDIKKLYSFHQYRTFRLFTSTAAFLIILIVIQYLDFNRDVNIVILLLAVAKYLESVSDVCYGLFQRSELMRIISISMMIKGSIALILTVFFVWYFRNAASVVAALLISWVVILFFYDLRQARNLLNKMSEKINNKMDIILFKSLFILALPLGFTILFNTLSFNIPRYIIVDEMDKEALGYYAAISYLLVAGATVINAIGLSATPRLANYYNENMAAYNRLIIKMVFLVGLIGLFSVIISVFFGELILEIFYTKEYAKYNQVFIWIMVGASVLYVSSIIGCALTAARSFISQSIFSMIVMISMLSFSMYLIPIYGLVGAAYAVAISYFIKLIGQSLQLFFLISFKGRHSQL